MVCHQCNLFQCRQEQDRAKQPSGAPWQLPVIRFPLVLLQLIVKCSNNHPTLQYRKDELIHIHSCNGARGMGQQQQGNGDGDDRSIDYNRTMATAIAMAPGQGHWGRSNRSNRSAMGQRQQQRSIVPIAIDHVDVDVWGMGRGRLLFRVFYSKRS
jgi:hypothetical protein